MRGVAAVLRSGESREWDGLLAGAAVVGSVLVVAAVLSAVMLVGPTGDRTGRTGDATGSRDGLSVSAADGSLRRTFAARFVEAPVTAGTWALDWGHGVRAPAVEQARQVAALRTVVGGAAALMALLAAMVAVGLLRQRDRLRRSEAYVHWAVGARPIHLVARLMASGWSWLVVLLLSGVVGGLGVPRLLSGTFPGSAEVPQNLAAALVLATGLLVVGVRWEGRAGRRSTRGAGWTGRIVSSPAAVAAVGFAALTGVGLLARHAPGVSPSADPQGRPQVVGTVSLAQLPAETRGRALSAWSGRAVAARPDARAGLASAGAARGTGYGAQVWVECGDCYEGGLPLPLKVVQAEIYAVAADTFPHLGLTLLEGRDFDDGLDVGTPDVAVVSRALAVRHFEGGEAVGRRVRVGTSAWLTVVGVVSDAPEARDSSEYAVYLPVTQAAPADVEILATSGDGLDSWLAAAPEGAGAATIRTRAGVFAVHRWFAGVLEWVGLIACVLVGLGVWLGSRSEARATTFELSLRRALGARRRDIHIHFLVSSTRRLALSMAMGAWLSLFLGAALEDAYGSIPHVDGVVWLRVGALITVAWTVGAWPSFRRARRVSPVVGLREADGAQ